MTLGSRVITITNGILIVVSSKTSYCQNHGNCMQVVRFFLTRIINVKSVVLKSYFQGGTVSEPVWNSTRDMRANKLQALLIFRSQGSFSQLLVHKKCARLTTVKTCSVGPWLSMRCYTRPLLLCSQAFREYYLGQLCERMRETWQAWLERKSS